MFTGVVVRAVQRGLCVFTRITAFSPSGEVDSAKEAFLAWKNWPPDLLIALFHTYGIWTSVKATITVCLASKLSTILRSLDNRTSEEDAGFSCSVNNT